VKTIYVVEPHSDTAALELELLQDAGFLVRVGSSTDAWTALAEDDIGLLVLTTDPRDGATASGLVTRARRAKVPVIVTTTGRPDHEHWSSAAAVLLKPFSFEELIAKVRAHFAAE
jgi:DNA-binding response OmpR family regulator